MTTYSDDNGSKKSEEEVERLVLEIGRAISEAPPEKQSELAQSAADLLREQISPAISAGRLDTTATSRPLNALALGVGFLVVGGGLAFLLPPVGMVLILAGLVGVVSGLVSRSIKHRRSAAAEREAQ